MSDWTIIRDQWKQDLGLDTPQNVANTLSQTGVGLVTAAKDVQTKPANSVASTVAEIKAMAGSSANQVYIIFALILVAGLVVISRKRGR